MFLVAAYKLGPFGPFFRVPKPGPLNPSMLGPVFEVTSVGSWASRVWDCLASLGFRILRIRSVHRGCASHEH